MIVRYTAEFVRLYKKANIRIKNHFKSQLTIFLVNPFDPRLNNHTLRTPYEGCSSINITADWRAIFRVEQDEGMEPVAYFISLGTHKQLYKNKTS